MSSRLVTIDCEYVQPQLAAAYLREEDGEVAFIEANTAHAVPKLLAALKNEGLTVEQVKYVIVTHVHLDHAGGASALMKACPNATLLAHPRAARHLIDPSKLVASATQVYGAEAFEKLYGTIEAIDANRVRVMEDDTEVQLGGATLRFLHTRGHANHHFVVHDVSRNAAFTGDAFGLVYPQLQREKRFAFPSTSPTDFDGPAAIASVKQIIALGVTSVALTHFGVHEDVGAIGEQLITWLELSTQLAAEGAASGDEVGTMEQAFKRRLKHAMDDTARAAGIKLNDADWALLKLDIELNAQGLAVAALRQRKIN